LIPSPSGGGLGWGWCIQSTPYHGLYTINVFQDFVVPGSQDAKSFGLEVPGTLGVEGLPFGMLASVNLNRKPRLHADKVHNVGSEGMLSAKPVALKLTHAEMTPQMLLCVGEVAS
jgi:hypothetical protein